MDEKVTLPKTIRTCYVFKDKISRVYPVITQMEKYHNLISDLISPVVMLKGEKSWDLGSEFEFMWYGYAKLSCTCTEVINTEHYKRFAWKVNAEIADLEYDYSESFYSNTSDNSTLFVWEWENEQPEKCPMTNLMIEGFKSIRYEMIKRWEKYLSTSLDDLYQFESIIIHSKIKEIFDIVSNWTVLQPIAPSIADQVEYEGDPLVIGTKFKISFLAKKMVCFLKVIQNETNENCNEWKYYLECYDGKPKVPLQEIHFNIIKISETCCYLSFKHIFKSPIKVEIIESLSEGKRDILSKIKEFLEHKE